MVKAAAARKLPPPPELELNAQTTTPAIRESLRELTGHLLCGLCNQILQNPSTISCAHTFCSQCIHEYACDAWECPIPGCRMPLTATGGRDGKYHMTNPELQTVVSSMDVIRRALNEAPEQWWNAGKEEEEVVDLQPDVSSPRADESASPDDSEATVGYPATSSNRNSPDWMDAIAEETDEEQQQPSRPNMSCILPSQSPNCSPIEHMASQVSPRSNASTSKRTLEDVTNSNSPKDPRPSKKERGASARFQEKTHSIAASRVSSVPTILVASKLSSFDRRLVKELAEQERLRVHSLDGGDDASSLESFDFAVCGNAVYKTGDGFVVRRTYAYLLALASGKPIVDISYLVEWSKTAGPLEVPAEGNKHQIIGDTDCTECMVAERSRIEPSKKLLENYTLILCGKFDRNSESQRRNMIDYVDCYSREHIKCLSRLCGATVWDLESVNDATQLSGRLVFLIRPKPHPRHWKATRKDVETHDFLQTRQEERPVLLSSDWFLDSIGDWKVKDMQQYTQPVKSTR